MMLSRGQAESGLAGGVLFALLPMYDAPEFLSQACFYFASPRPPNIPQSMYYSNRDVILWGCKGVEQR